MNPNFGRTGIDKITKFKGVITGLCSYISGCSQYLLVPPVDEKGKLAEGQWFDEQRVEFDDQEPQIQLDNGETPGCDRLPTRNY